MGSGFGRVVVNGVTLDDPYSDKLEGLDWFEVISDAGPRYRVERFTSRRWKVSRVDPTPTLAVGTVMDGGSMLNRWYSYKREGRILSSGQQNMFINAVFGLVESEVLPGLRSGKPFVAGVFLPETGLLLASLISGLGALLSFTAVMGALTGFSGVWDAPLTVSLRGVQWKVAEAWMYLLPALFLLTIFTVAMFGTLIYLVTHPRGRAR